MKVLIVCGVLMAAFFAYLGLSVADSGTRGYDVADMLVRGDVR